MRNLIAATSLACSLAFVVVLASAEDNGGKLSISNPPTGSWADSARSSAIPLPVEQQAGTVLNTVDELVASTGPSEKPGSLTLGE